MDPQHQLLTMLNSLSFSSDTCRTDAQEQLDSWFNSSMMLLQNVYREKQNEINQLYDTLEKNLQVYKQKQAATIGKQNNQILQREIEELEQQLPNMIEVKTTPGSIDDLQVCLKSSILETPTVFSNLRQSLLRTNPVQCYRFSSTCRALAPSIKRDEILLYEKDELILYHVNGNLSGSVSWSSMENGFVSDLTWCSILDGFLVLSRLKLSLFNPHLFTCTDVKQIRGTQSNQLIALTYNEQDQTVFICSNDSNEMIRQFGPLPHWILKKSWSKEQLIEKEDTGIRCIRLNRSGSQIVLMIKTKSDQFRVAFYSADFKKMMMTISLCPWKNGRSIDFMLYMNPFIDDRWWIIVYGNGTHEQSLLLVDNQTGESQIIVKDSILNCCLLDEQYLIVRMKQMMLIYDIQ